MKFVPCLIVPSQFVVKATINREKGRKSVATKVALQMNCKLGGELWETEMPVRFAFLYMKTTFLFEETAWKIL